MSNTPDTPDINTALAGIMNANDVLTQWRAQIYDASTPIEHWVHLVLQADAHRCLDATMAWAAAQVNAPEEMRRVLGLVEMVGVSRVRRAVRLVAELPKSAGQVADRAVAARALQTILPGAFVERAVVQSSSILRLVLPGGWLIEIFSGWPAHIYAPPVPGWMVALGSPRGRLAGCVEMSNLGSLVWLLYVVDKAYGLALKAALDWVSANGRVNARHLGEMSRLLGACCGTGEPRLGQGQVFDRVCAVMAQFGMIGEATERRWYVKDGSEFSRLWWTPVYGGMTLWIGTDISGDLEPLADWRVPLYVEFQAHPEMGFGPVRPTGLTPLLDAPDAALSLRPPPRNLPPRFA